MVRLNNYTLNSTKELFKNNNIYLFVSRTKNTLGEDIDLLIDDKIKS